MYRIVIAIYCSVLELYVKGIAVVYCIPQTVSHIPYTISHIGLKNVSDINIILYCITIHGYISLPENTYINPIYRFTVIVGKTVNVGNILPYILWSTFLMTYLALLS
jgi:hypothetical protein